MNKTSSAPVPDVAQAETFEFLIGLAEQRCMVLHPRSIHAGFVNDSEPAGGHQTQRSQLIIGNIQQE